MKKISLLVMGFMLSVSAMGDDAPFSIVEGLFDATLKETMGLTYAPGAETVTVWAAADNGNHYANGVVMAAFKGTLYCVWQTSKKDEDADDTYVAYARSTDGGQTWSEPMVLCPTVSNGYCASGGWLADGRIIGAAHFQPGLKLCPIYTDDPTGRTGWKKGKFQYTANGSQSAELEPSFFLQQDGTLVMVMRDQKGSYVTNSSNTI